MTRKTTHREKLLATTARFLRDVGYHGAGLHEILAAADAPRGSLYFHFPGGKEELAAAAIEQAARELCHELKAATAAAANATEALAAVALALGDRLRQSEFREGCPLSTVALEMSAHSERVRGVAHAGFAAWHEVLVDRLTQDGYPRDRAASLATFALSAIEGALVLCRVQKSLEPLARVCAELEHTLRLTKPAPKPKK
jgi:TetR/AcrR family transcriptional repressor of lmrAB and yxaGH operons